MIKHGILPIGLCLIMMLGGAVYGDVAVVRGGQPVAVIVIPTDALPVVTYAAEELVLHVQKASGAELTIVSEDAIPAEPAGRIYLGSTAAALAAGLDPAALKPEECFVKSEGNVLYIAGEDTDGNPMANDTRPGTLWGVYELLERDLGAHWLWPGDLGIHVNKGPDVTFSAVDEIISPIMLQRNLRPGLWREEGPFQNFTEEGLANYREAQSAFLRRHRMGRSMPLRYGHAFYPWWEQYKDTHPEWFQLLENGERGPSRPGAHFSMCVSNEEFRKEVIRRWWENLQANPDGAQNVNGTENDIGGLCTCENCVAWDGPQPAPGEHDLYAGTRNQRVVSDRYAKFWLDLYDRAKEFVPEPMVMGYAYVNYYPAPSEDITLNPDILVGLCPWPGMWYPRYDNEQEWLKEQWQGWARTGARVFYRPNTTLDGYCMPHVYSRQLADELQFYARNSMVGTDFDSLTGQWATQGPTLYLLARLHVQPLKPVDELLGEYYSGFGPAADKIAEYFDYWEEYTLNNRERLETALSQARASRYRQYAKAAHVAYPLQVFAPAQQMLQEAAQLAAGDPEYSERVAFLQIGLDHAMLTVRAAALLGGAEADISPLAGYRVVEELAEFRKRNEGTFFSNISWCASNEARSWVLPSGYSGEALRPISDAVAPLDEPGPVLSFRGRFTFVVNLQAGESFRALAGCRRIGASEVPLSWSLFAPDDTRVAGGTIEIGEERELDIRVPVTGTYLFLANSGSSVGRVTLHNDHASITGRRLPLVYANDPLHFYVPEGVAEFKVILSSPAPGETAKITVFNPDGEEVAQGSTGELTEYIAELTAAPQHQGKGWTIAIDRAESGIHEDYVLTLGEELPPYWAQAADRLLVPQ